MTYDIGLTLDHFPPVANGIGMFMPDSAEPLGVCTIETFEVRLRPLLAIPVAISAINLQT
jgi:hypothetical protein